MLFSSSMMMSATGLGIIQYVGGAVQADPGSTGTVTMSLTSLTGGIDTQPRENDLVLVHYGVGSAGGGGADNVNLSVTGYAELCDLFDTYTNSANLSVNWKLMTASPDTSITLNSSGNAANARATAVQVWRGVNLITPFDVTLATATDSASGSRRANPGSITPVTSGAVIIVVGSSVVSDTSANSIFTASYADNFQSIWSDDTYDAVIGCGSVIWTSGAYNPAAFSTVADSANDAWCAVTLVLRPA